MKVIAATSHGSIAMMRGNYVVKSSAGPKMRGKSGLILTYVDQSGVSGFVG